MFCSKCGQENPSNSKFCSGCGNTLASSSANPVIQNTAVGTVESMTFSKSISTCFSKYASFNGRASRAEYWWFYLFCLLIMWGASIVDDSGGTYLLMSIAMASPQLAVGARRLHDTNKSGWWQLIALTLIGLIPLIIWLASEGSKETNQFGEPPNL